MVSFCYVYYFYIYEKTYYWKIIAWDDSGESTEGAIWEFTTIEEQELIIEITQPEENYFYLRNMRLFGLNNKTFIYGPITIIADVTSETDIERVEFYAFEPDKVNRYQLYANLFINKLEQVIKVYTCGLSDYDGEASFQSYDESNRGKSRLSSQGDSSVTVNRLDGLLSFKDEVIGFKIDVEGHEVGVVAGMQELLKNNKCILQIESFADKLSSLSLQMENLGYKKIHSIKNDHYFSNIGNI